LCASTIATVDESPIAELLTAVDQLDAGAVAALFAPDVRLLTADGRRAEGVDAARALLTDFLGQLRSISSRITDEWRDRDVWIAEVETTYELRDYFQKGPVPRAIIVRNGPDGIADVRVYGAQEQPLAERPAAVEGMWLRERWIPPL
jgi:hypothetical protein